jgi:phospholipid/cholesterol/gamma-HCH transport system substrate-binding protein
MRSHSNATAAAIAALILLTASGCGWRGVNSLPLPGTEGSGPESYVIQAQMPDVTNIQPNSRVRVGDVNVGTVTKVERQGWHALITMKVNRDVDLPANSTAKLGQTSVLGTLHIELAPPADVAPQGRLHSGSLIPLPRGKAYPDTEQTLAALSMLLNGGGLGKIQDITAAFSTALKGRETDLRDFTTELDGFIGGLNNQKDDILSATDSLDKLTAQFAQQKPVIDAALTSIPDALSVVSDNRDNLAEALDQFGKFGALTYDTVTNTRDALVHEVNDAGPVLQSLADAGPALTRSLSLYSTFPWPKETIEKWFRGDYGNMTLILDLTASRIDNTLLTGTRFEGGLTRLEIQWGRTVGQLPSPATADNPLTLPYHLGQGP